MEQPGEGSGWRGKVKNSVLDRLKLSFLWHIQVEMMGGPLGVRAEAKISFGSMVHTWLFNCDVEQGGWSSVGEHVPGMCEVLGSVLSALFKENKRKRKVFQEEVAPHVTCC